MFIKLDGIDTENGLTFKIFYYDGKLWSESSTPVPLCGQLLNINIWKFISFSYVPEKPEYFYGDDSHWSQLVGCKTINATTTTKQNIHLIFTKDGMGEYNKIKRIIEEKTLN